MVFGLQREFEHKYLGNNFFPSNRRKDNFDPIKRKIFNRLESWKAKLLSQAGQRTLVQHVIYSIPLYAMATAKIPIGVCEEVEKLSRALLWKGDVNAKKGWVPMAWKNICKPKFCGGLGLRKLSAMNSALLGKIGWALTQNLDKRWTRAIKAKYFPTSSFMNCRKKKDAQPFGQLFLIPEIL